MQLKQNKAKIRGCLKSGYSIRIVIWGAKKKLISDVTHTQN